MKTFHSCIVKVDKLAAEVCISRDTDDLFLGSVNEEKVWECRSFSQTCSRSHDLRDCEEFDVKSC